MADSDGGMIINVSASGALMPTPGIVPYGCSKAALNAMGLSFAHEFGPKVRVNTISPGLFQTDMLKAWSAERLSNVPNAVKRAAQPSEIATTALYLASPASSYTTGALVRVDGGAW